MGDRANIHIREDHADHGVYLYTHWNGTELPATLQKALARKQRWNNPAYLARIIFDTMTDGEHGSETGHGIATRPCDGQDRILQVDTDLQIVTRGHIREPGSALVEGAVWVASGTWWTFDAFLTLTPAELDRVWGD